MFKLVFTVHWASCTLAATKYRRGGVHAPPPPCKTTYSKQLVKLRLCVQARTLALGALHRGTVLSRQVNHTLNKSRIIIVEERGVFVFNMLETDVQVGTVYSYHVFSAYTVYPLGTRRCCDVESTSTTLIQRPNNVVCPVGIPSTNTGLAYYYISHVR